MSSTANSCPLTNISQIAFVVKDLDTSVERYTSLWGLGPWQIWTVDYGAMPGVTFRGKSADFSVRVAMTRFGPFEFELVQPLQGNSPHQEFLDKHGEGMHHMAALVDDFQTVHDDLVQRGFRLALAGPIPGKDRDGSFAFFEPDDAMATTLELLDYPDEPIRD